MPNNIAPVPNLRFPSLRFPSLRSGSLAGVFLMLIQCFMVIAWATSCNQASQSEEVHRTPVDKGSPLQSQPPLASDHEAESDSPDPGPEGPPEETASPPLVGDRLESSPPLVRTPSPSEYDRDTLPYFPWPPPKPSGECSIPRELLVSSDQPVLLGDVASKLESAFSNAGYGGLRYFGFGDPSKTQATGFVLVSRLEQIKKDGSSMDPPDRWSTRVPPERNFSLKSFLSALFTARPGYYRLIVVVVTDKSFTTSNEGPTESEATDWFASGSSQLPPSIAHRPFHARFKTRAFIYEFEKKTQDHEPEIRDPGRFGGKVHLIKAKVWQGLEGD